MDSWICLKWFFPSWIEFFWGYDTQNRGIIPQTTNFQKHHPQKLNYTNIFFLASKHVLLRLILVSTSKSRSNHKFLLVMSKKFIHDDDDYDDMKQTSLHHFYRTRKEIRKKLFYYRLFMFNFWEWKKLLPCLVTWVAKNDWNWGWGMWYIFLARWKYMNGWMDRWM